jgi:hypothetical protein
MVGEETADDKLAYGLGAERLKRTGERLDGVDMMSVGGEKKKAALRRLAQLNPCSTQGSPETKEPFRSMLHVTLVRRDRAGFVWLGGSRPCSRYLVK